ncbi:MAG: 2-nitropropane dioxygenase [Benjaminiella poitrasii]|nr:MAG: 2-nitropropane dioxygenase [Benjaminiella poitrasii]
MTIAQTIKWATTEITKVIHIQYPIIQAPCAGHTNADLVAAVSNAGGLGSLGAGMMPAPELREMIREIRKRTSKPFAVNLFCRDRARPKPSYTDLQRHYGSTDDVLNEIRSELNIPIPTEYQPRSPPLEDQVNVLLEERIPVVSFTFGLLSDSHLQRFWSVGTYLIGTATTVEEAFVLAGLNHSDPTRKADAIVAQGLEAGGHRGSFLKESQQASVKELVMAIANSVQPRKFPIPVLAAGGISSGLDIYSALHDWKADGVAIGTLFILATESSTPKAHKEYLLEASKNKVEETKITTAITGKSVRSYPNQLMKRLEHAVVDTNDIPPYDIQSAKTRDIAVYATQHGIKEYMMLLSGANAPAAAEYSQNGTLSAAEILNKLILDVNKQYDIQ